MFDPQNYWNNRLKSKYSLKGVGDITLGVYNNYLYILRKFVFKMLVRRHLPQISDKTIMDVGAGTGFYINLWSKYKPKKIYGIDISEYAVSQLKTKFKSDKFEFIHADISDFNFDKTVDFISAFDVFYHITEDEKYLKALSQIFETLNPNGIFIFSDNLIRHNKEIRKQHQVCRSENFIISALYSAGFTVKTRVPMFVLMNQSFFPTNIFTKYTFPYASKIARKSSFWAHTIGALMLPAEMLLVALLKRSRSSEIIICKKTS